MEFFSLSHAMRPYRIDTFPYHLAHNSEDEPPLTVVPEHLRDAYVAFLLGENLDCTVRALFMTINGDVEMKYLDFTMTQYLERLSAWPKERARRSGDQSEQAIRNDGDPEDECSDDCEISEFFAHYLEESQFAISD
ncbi:MAG: hypothetical protein L6R42_000249 [Xanthoria sp. 1 TBL-2021]|nr:MAG: hypothetical protein L6R42_000249 [Xanthoria sp. 1 TBL-2021]